MCMCVAESQSCRVLDLNLQLQGTKLYCIHHWPTTVCDQHSTSKVPTAEAHAGPLLLLKFLAAHCAATYVQCICQVPSGNADSDQCYDEFARCQESSLPMNVAASSV